MWWRMALTYRMVFSASDLGPITNALILSLTGITFSPNGSFAYVTDTRAQLAYYGHNLSAPSSMYVRMLSCLAQLYS